MNCHPRSVAVLHFHLLVSPGRPSSPKLSQVSSALPQPCLLAPRPGSCRSRQARSCHPAPLAVHLLGLCDRYLLRVPSILLWSSLRIASATGSLARLPSWWPSFHLYPPKVRPAPWPTHPGVQDGGSGEPRALPSYSMISLPQQELGTLWPCGNR